MRREMLTAQHLKEGELEIIENNGVSMSATELLAMIKTGQIPLLDPPRMDERRYCRLAIDACGQAGGVSAKNAAGAARCASLVREGKRTWCSLNGCEAKSPCVFDEPQSAEVWEEIREYVARWGLETPDGPGASR